MQKIKYLIIFTLILALGLLYLQIIDYKIITNQLISTNSTLESEQKTLSNELNKTKIENINLKETIKNQNQKIITLEENLTNQKIQIKEINFTIPQTTLDYKDIPNIENNVTKIDNDKIDISPSIFLDEEQKVDGFHIELKQKF